MLDRRLLTLAGIGAAIAGVAAMLTRSGSQQAAAASDTFEVTKTDAEWRKLLTAEQHYVLRRHGTERAGSSPLDKQYGPGTYACAGCDLPLFSSDTKYDSGTGWPSFWKPLDGALGMSTDYILLMPRTEVHCTRCGGHLGHRFEDGPPPTGLRYCINGVALAFKPDAPKAA